MSGAVDARVDDRRPLPTLAAVLELARIAATRAVRSRALWVVATLAVLPAAVGVVIGARSTDSSPADVWRVLFEMVVPLLVVVPPVLVASAVSDELEDGTSAYLWSRAIPRWTVVVGKLLVLAPLAAILVGGAGGLAGAAAGLPTAVYLDGAIGLAAGAAAASAVAAAIGTLVPRHAVAMTMAWMVVVDYPLHLLDFGVRHLSTGFGATAIAGHASGAGVATGAITLAVLTALGTGLACWRIGRLE